ncbi:NYN domain-containing protein [Amycolatopsis thermalba]|uniref:NYN domain-containing protein n=1 Tax=Amycolatopsis thermalba TaxID=944492 RepID=A0ABY4NLZ2_9PSEU|nr:MULTISPECIES: NYN domain-containing protein [Amycolatopsis]UQS21400.1 NYN domain-containing protein [Amycolatopsis thermalba]
MPLRASVIIDYQNVHLTGHGLFDSTRFGPPHEALVDPLHFANQLIQVRNQRQRPGMDHAVLRKVLVYRGLPSPDHDPKAYARNLAQQAHWERDGRVTVHLRPLKYDYHRDATGAKVVGPDGKYLVRGKAEKGVDVLCALALVREALDPNVDLVILASQDSDLEPALDEALALGSAKVETFAWFNPGRSYKSAEIRPASRRIWNTRMGETEFRRCWDVNSY